MAIDVFDSLEKIRTGFDGAKFLDSNSSRKDALEKYFSMRGVVQLDNSHTHAWPALVYPTIDKAEKHVKELEEKMRKADEKRKSWEKTHWRSSTHETFSQFTKLSDPLFWKHSVKAIVDPQYRSDAKAVGMRTALVADEKYRGMVDAFVNNPAYRKQLTEAVASSPAYQNHKGLAKQAQDRQKMQVDVSRSLLDKMEAELAENETKLRVWKELLKWAKDSEKYARKERTAN